MEQMTPTTPHLRDELLSERLDDRQAAATQQRVDAHLAACTDCAARYADLRVTQAALRSMRQVAVPRDFRLDVATPPASPHPLPFVHSGGFARLLSTAALLCGLIFVVVGLATFTLADNTAMHLASSTAGAAQPAPLTPTNCTFAAHCASVNAGDGGDIPPTSPPNGSQQAAGNSSSSIKTAASPEATIPPRNTTLPLVVSGLGLLLLLGGGAGLLRQRGA